MSEFLDPIPFDDPMVIRLVALRDEADAAGHALLTYLIDVAVVEAERIVEHRETGERQPERRGGRGSGADPSAR